jgi:hypothetical protein
MCELVEVFDKKLRYFFIFLPFFSFFFLVKRFMVERDVFSSNIYIKNRSMKQQLKG